MLLIVRVEMRCVVGGTGFHDKIREGSSVTLARGMSVPATLFDPMGDFATRGRVFAETQRVQHLVNDNGPGLLRTLFQCSDEVASAQIDNAAALRRERQDCTAAARGLAALSPSSTVVTRPQARCHLAVRHCRQVRESEISRISRTDRMAPLLSGAGTHASA